MVKLKRALADKGSSLESTGSFYVKRCRDEGQDKVKNRNVFDDIMAGYLRMEKNTWNSLGASIDNRVECIANLAYQRQSLSGVSCLLNNCARNKQFDDDSANSQNERECISHVAMAAAEQLNMLVSQVLPAPAVATSSSADIRIHKIENAVDRDGVQCRVDFAGRRLSVPAVKRESSNTGTGLKRVKWSEEEETALVEGLKKHKGLYWGKILTDPEFAETLRLRRSPDLKDKYRILRKGTKFEHAFSEIDAYRRKI
jgi:hypothetical protein